MKTRREKYASPGIETRLDELLSRLEYERGMGRKVRLLAGAWPLLRQLSPRQRERVALALGSRWARRNFESMFGSPDKLSDNQLRVRSIFEKMSEADPDQLRSLGREIKTGGVAGARSRLLGALEEALEDKITSEEESLADELTQADGDGAAHAPEESHEPGDSDPQRPLAEEAETAQLERDSKRTAGAALEGGPGIPAVSREAAAEPQPSEPAPSEPRPEEPGEPGGIAPTRSQRAPGPLESAADLARLEQAQADRRRRDAATLSAIESLRALRRLSGGDTGSSRAGRAALVGSLGSGWAARRAVSALIRSHSAADLEEALALIRTLPSATQRTWCLGDLLQHWELDDDARERVLAAVSTRAAKRRLARRVPRTA